MAVRMNYRWEPMEADAVQWGLGSGLLRVLKVILFHFDEA